MNIMFKKRKGFNGLTHCLIALLLFEALWFTPFVNDIKDKSTFLIIIYWFIVVGAALLPDLDNNISSAGYALGVFGKIIHGFMVSSSSFIFNLVRTKNDRTNSQHRMFWHTPFSCLILFVYCYFTVKNIDDSLTVFNIVKDGEFINDISGYLNYFLVCFLCMASFYLSINVLCYRVGKVLSFMKAVKPIVVIIVFVYFIYSAKSDYIMQCSIAVCLGCFFHIVGDMFTKGSSPFFFPIPIKRCFWYKPQLLAIVETGGWVNSIIDIVLAIVDTLFLFVIIGIKIPMNF